MDAQTRAQTHFIDCKLDELSSSERAERLKLLYDFMRCGAQLPRLSEISEENLFVNARTVERALPGDTSAARNARGDASILVIGDAPSQDDARSGQAFSGAARLLLDDVLSRLPHERLYFTHLVKVRREDWKSGATIDPNFEEVCSYADLVIQEILLVRPRVILALGRISASLLRCQFAPDRLLDVVSLEHNKEKARRARARTLDGALELYAKLRSTQRNRTTLRDCDDIDRAPFEFDLTQARMRLVSLYQLQRLEDRISLFSVASCGYSCRVFCAEDPIRSVGTHIERMMRDLDKRQGSASDAMVVDGGGGSDGAAAAPLEAGSADRAAAARDAWAATLEPLRTLLDQPPPPVYVMEPNHVLEPRDGHAPYDRLPRRVRRQDGGGHELVGGTCFYERNLPSAHALAEQFDAGRRPLLFQVHAIEYNVQRNCFETFGRTFGGQSVCARVFEPYFEFSARLLDPAFVAWLRADAADALEPGAEAAWLCAQVREFVANAGSYMPQYVRVVGDAASAGALRSEREERLVNTFKQEFGSIDVSISVNEKRSSYFIVDANEPFVRVVYRHKEARALVEEALRHVLGRMASRRAREKLGLSAAAIARSLRELGPQGARVEFFELDSDNVQQFCLRSNVTTSGWMCIAAPLQFAESAARESDCDIEVVCVQDAVGGVSTKCEDVPRYNGVLVRDEAHHIAEAEPTSADAAFARATLPPAWNANAPYKEQSMDIEALGPHKGIFPSPEDSPVVSICCTTKTFDARPGNETLNETLCDERRKVRPSGRVNCEAYVFALKSVKRIAPPLYDPALQPDSLHNKISGVRALFTAQHVAYLRAIAYPHVDESKPDAYALDSRFLLSHFAQATLDDESASAKARAAARTLVGSRALQHYRLTPTFSWPLVHEMLPSLIAQCRCGCAIEAPAQLARTLMVDETALPRHAASGGAALSREERHLLIFVRWRFDKAGVHEWLFADAEKRFFAVTRPRGEAPSATQPWAAPREHPVIAADAPKEKRWDWGTIERELCSSLPGLVEPVEKRLTWRQAGRVLPALLKETQCKCGCRPRATIARTPAQIAKQHLFRFLRDQFPAEYAYLHGCTDTASGSGGLNDVVSAGPVWRAPEGPYKWDAVLEALSAHTPGLVEGYMRTAETGLEYVRGEQSSASALSTWNVPPHTWLQKHGTPLLERFNALYPASRDEHALVFTPQRLMHALLARVEAPPNYAGLPQVERERGETLYALAEAAKACNWYAFRPVPRVFTFDTEEELLEAYAHFSVDYDADVLTGYNFQKFDYWFLLERTRVLGVQPQRFGGIYQIGRMRRRKSEVSRKKFSSRAYGEREIVTVKNAGRCMLDALDYVHREKKFASYTLGYVSQMMLGDTKDDVPHTVLYSLFMHNREKLHRYCLKDAELCMRLLAIENVVEFALDMVKLISALPLADLYVRGQQARVVSLLLRHMRDKAPHLLLPTQRSRTDHGPEKPAVSVAPDAAAWLAAERVLAAVEAQLAADGIASDVVMEAEAEAPLESLDDGVQRIAKRYASYTRSRDVAKRYVETLAIVEAYYGENDDDVDEIVGGAARHLNQEEDERYESQFLHGLDPALAAAVGATSIGSGGGDEPPPLESVPAAEAARGADRGAMPAQERPMPSVAAAAARPMPAPERPPPTMQPQPPKHVHFEDTGPAISLGAEAPPLVRPRAAAATTPVSRKRKTPEKAAAPKRKLDEVLAEGAKEHGFAKKKAKKKASTVSYEGAFVFNPVCGIWLDSPIVCFD